MSNVGRQLPPACSGQKAPPLWDAGASARWAPPLRHPLFEAGPHVASRQLVCISSSGRDAPPLPLKIPETSRLKDHYSYAHTPWSTGMALDQ